MGVLNRAGDILVRAGVIDDLQRRAAAAHQEQWGGSLSRAVVELGLAAENDVVDALAWAVKVPRVRLDELQADPHVLAKVTLHFCEQRTVFPVALRDQGKTLVLAMADPTDLSVVDEAMGLARCRVQPVLAGELEIGRAVDVHYKHMAVAHGPSRARQAVSRAGEASGSFRGDEQEFRRGSAERLELGGHAREDDRPERDGRHGRLE